MVGREGVEGRGGGGGGGGCREGCIIYITRAVA